jgi:hypothetical protein
MTDRTGELTESWVETFVHDDGSETEAAATETRDTTETGGAERPGG